jgi:hypothetical protein
VEVFSCSFEDIKDNLVKGCNFIEINKDPKPWTEDPDLARKDRADERRWGY